MLCFSLTPSIFMLREKVSLRKRQQSFWHIRKNLSDFVIPSCSNTLLAGTCNKLCPLAVSLLFMLFPLPRDWNLVPAPLLELSILFDIKTASICMLYLSFPPLCVYNVWQLHVPPLIKSIIESLYKSHKSHWRKVVLLTFPSKMLPPIFSLILPT